MTVKFLKKGKALHEEAAKENERVASGDFNPYTNRFWMPDEDERRITFLDGDINEDGLIETVGYYEHQIKMNGHWRNFFPCVRDEEPCPLCEDGDNPSLVSLFTVIDHTGFKIKKGDNAGKTIKNFRTLYVAKRESLKKLQHLAEKREGLVGCTFDVARLGDKAANVGSDFDFIEKNSMAKLRKKYELDEETVTPFDYEDIIQYRNAKGLRKLGFGSGMVGGGADDLPAGGGFRECSCGWDVPRACHGHGRAAAAHGAVVEGQFLVSKGMAPTVASAAKRQERRKGRGP
jgi:hypothetical protein